MKFYNIFAENNCLLHPLKVCAGNPNSVIWFTVNVEILIIAAECKSVYRIKSDI